MIEDIEESITKENGTAIFRKTGQL